MKINVCFKKWIFVLFFSSQCIGQSSEPDTIWYDTTYKKSERMALGNEKVVSILKVFFRTQKYEVKNKIFIMNEKIISIWLSMRKKVFLNINHIKYWSDKFNVCINVKCHTMQCMFNRFPNHFLSTKFNIKLWDEYMYFWFHTCTVFIELMRWSKIFEMKRQIFPEISAVYFFYLF